MLYRLRELICMSGRCYRDNVSLIIRSILWMLLMMVAQLGNAQEICNNAVDDDGDGLIDLNDDECLCEGFGGASNLTSMIPNSSFEDRTCCPTTYSMLDCAETWIQASNPTSDYWNMCGAAGSNFDGGTVLPPPDGEGFVGFINMNGWQEYVGACLSSTMTAGQEYNFTFWFGHTNNSPPIELTFYGTPNCGDLPFNSNDCPTGIGGFITLGSSTMGGGTGWVQESVSFTPPIDINAIVIGGACGSGGARTYYYLDDLTLVSTEQFEVLSVQQLGQYCDNNIVLDAEADTFGGTWQWYKDGIALIGEVGDDHNVLAGPAGVGLYTATYTIGSQCESIDIEVVEPDLPSADFDALNVCFPNETAFTDLSVVATGAVTDWLWDFGDGQTSSQQNPAHSYLDDGTYTVQLTVTTDINCTDTYQSDITVYPRPEAAFTVVPGCLGYATLFSDQTTISPSGSIDQYLWDFGDQTASAQQNPTHFFASENSFDVQLKVISSDGCADSTSQQVDVYPSPQVNVSASNACVSDAIQFTNGSSIASGVIAQHTWNMGDGTSLSSAAPIHQYLLPGTFTVEYIALSDQGCASDTVFDVVAYPDPVADIVVTDACADSPVQLQDNSAVAAPGSIVSTLLNWGDGNSDTIVPAQYQYATSGTYNVELIVITQHGCDDTAQVNVNVHDMPVADFSFSNICEDDSVLFNDLSSIATGTLADHFWNFGNGTTSTVAQPGYQPYPADGFYDIQLIVSSGFGCADTMQDVLEVYPVPIADLTFDSVCFPLPVQFIDLSDPNGAYDLISWNWTFSDGQTSTDQHPAVVFTSPGIYSAQLLVTNGPGCKNDVTSNGNAVVHPLPVADLDEGIAVCLEDTIFFEDLSQLEPVTDDQIIAWNWDLDDGNTLSTQNGMHVYAAADLYDVELTVQTNHGCTDSKAALVEIYPLPTVDLTAEPLQGCAPLRVQFTDASSIASPYQLVGRQWNLGMDTSMIQAPQPVYIYDPEMEPLDVATFDVWLRSISENGCVSELLRPEYITVYPKPDALFAVDEDVRNIIDPEFVFTDLSTENVVVWSWSFGDGFYSDQQHPVHEFEQVGTYPIELMVETAYGCTDTVGYEVKVEPVFTFYIPSSFTPDNNGINDTFYGKGEGYTFYSMYIYDRWGELIFQSNDDQYHWDGTYMGQQVQQGTYVYRFYLLDWKGHDHEYKGIVTLHR